jgi:hypothetical protein
MAKLSRLENRLWAIDLDSALPQIQGLQVYFRIGDVGFLISPQALGESRIVYADDLGASFIVPAATSAEPLKLVILDKSGNGNHAIQATTALQPTYQIDNEGNPNLTFSGSYTQLATSAIDFTATAQMMVGIGLNVVSSASAAAALELGTDVNSVNGTFLIGAPSAVADHSLYLRGTSTIRAAVNNISDGDDIIVGLFDISQATKELELIPRLNRVQISGSDITWTGTTAGTGNFGNLPLYMGARSGGTLPFQGKIYQVIVRGALTNASDIVSTENLIDAKLD